MNAQAIENGYLLALRRELEQRKRYPSGRQASLERPQGNVEVWLEVDRSGRVLSSGIANKAASMLLNRAAMSSLQSISSVKPFPSEAFAGQTTKKIYRNVQLSGALAQGVNRLIFKGMHTMKSFNRSGIYLAVMSAMLPGAALAADATDVGTISVKGQSLGGGMMVQDDSAKARSTVTKEAMDKMPSAANAIDKLKYTPGLNVNSNDASGLSGVDYTMRGMNSDQIGLSMDGIPINDSGNYAVYPNLLGDAENLEEVFVTQGSSEADGPHIGSSGGNIGLVTRRPAKDFGGFVKQTLGSNSLSKTFARLDTGEYNGFSNWLSLFAHRSEEVARRRATVLRQVRDELAV